jgi:hypothetical protein
LNTYWRHWLSFRSHILHYLQYCNPVRPFWNLLSEGIINSDGSPGAHFSNAAQSVATDTTVTPGTYSPTPPPNPGPATLQTPDTTYAYGNPQNVPDPRWASTTIPDGLHRRIG